MTTERKGLAMDDKVTEQFLHKVEKLTEYTRELKVSIDRLDNRIELFSQRLDEVEQNIADLNSRSYNCCPIHDEVVSAFKERLETLDRDVLETKDRLETVRDGFRDEIRFRDKLLYGILGTIVAQILATIFMIHIK